MKRLTLSLAIILIAGISSLMAQEDIFSVVEEPPLFPGCEKYEDNGTRQACSFKHLMNHIVNELEYPEKAKEAGVEGTGVVSYVVEKDGSLSGIVVVKSVTPECDKEMVRVVESMPNWIPGKQRGRVVRTSMKLPIKFSLGKGKAQE